MINDADRDEVYRQNTFRWLWLLTLGTVVHVYFTARPALLLFYFLNFRGYGPSPEPPPLTADKIAFLTLAISFVISPLIVTVGAGTGWMFYARERYRLSRVTIAVTLPWLAFTIALAASRYLGIYLL